MSDPNPINLPGDEPSAAVWSRLGLIPERRVPGGHQSIVYRARRSGGGPDEDLAIKFVARDLADESFDYRIGACSAVAAICPAVVGPKLLREQLTTSVDRWLVVAYPWIAGTNPSTERRDDVLAMATTLADLHRALRAIEGFGNHDGLNGGPLPPVRALRPPPGSTVGSRNDPGKRSQLIHGDFAAANLIATPAGLRVIDFDDCGTGSVDLDVGNSLYLVLFDAWNDRCLDRYTRFRSWFVGAYSARASHDLVAEALDQAIQIRIDLLGRWLASPEDAPLGIRTATPAWHRRLRSFIGDVDGRADLG